MKITIYELLGMIKDGKAPKKIKYNDKIYYYDKNFMNYACDLDDGDTLYLLEDTIEELILQFNYEVEILEEEKKIPEKIKSNGKEFYCDNIDSWIDKEKTSAYCEYLMNKYNDLIDYLKSKGDE